MKRQDIHCPSRITPQDYQFQCVVYLGTNEDLAFAAQDDIRQVQELSNKYG